MIKVEFCANTMDELRSSVRSFLGQPSEAVQPFQPAVSADAIPAAPGADAPAPAEAHKPDDAPKTTEAKQYKIEEIRALMRKFIEAKGKDAALKILSALGVTNVTSLAPEKYPELAEKLEVK